MTLTREEWKAVAYCTDARPMTGKRENLAHPYVYRNASDQTVAEAMMIRLVNKGVISGCPIQSGLSPDLRFTLTPAGAVALAEADKKFDKKGKRERGAG